MTLPAKLRNGDLNAHQLAAYLNLNVNAPSIMTNARAVASLGLDSGEQADLLAIKALVQAGTYGVTWVEHVGDLVENQELTNSEAATLLQI